MRVAILLLAVALWRCDALYEDQAGSFDWYKQYVGTVSHLRFTKHKSRLCLATDQNIVSCLDQKDGSIGWRKSLTSTDGVDDLVVIEKPSSLITLSGGGLVLRSWDTSSGALKWEVRTTEEGVAREGSSLHLVQSYSGAGKYLVVLSSENVQVFEPGRGDLVAQAALDQLPSALTTALSDTGGPSITIAQVGPTSQVAVYKVDKLTGAVHSRLATTSPRPLGTQLVLHDGTVVISSSCGQYICTFDTQEGAEVKCQEVGSLIGDQEVHQGQGVMSMRFVAPGTLAIVTPSGAALLSLVGGQWSNTASFSAAQAVSEVMDVAGQPLVALAERKADHLQLQVVDVTSGSLVSSMAAALPQEALGGGAIPRVSRAALGLGKSNNQAPGWRVAVVLDDGQLLMVHDQEVAWWREEALGAVLQSHFIDLPAPARTAEGAGLSLGSPKFKDWLRVQLLSFKIQFRLNTPEESQEFLHLRSALSTKNQPTRDTNRFRRLIVVLTAPGKVLALHNGDGRVMWSYLYPPQQRPCHLHVWKTFHDVSHAPQIAAITMASNQEAQGFASVINAHTGQEVERLDLPKGVGKVLPLPLSTHDGKAQQNVFLLAPGTVPSDALSITTFLLPSSIATQEAFQQHHQTFYFWDFCQLTNSLRGFAFDQASLQPDGSVLARASWSTFFPQPVLTIAAKDPQEPLYSSVKILGDRSLKYKYVNANLLVVVTGPPLGVATKKLQEQELQVTAYIMDAVNGRVLHSQYYAPGRGPVHALVSENWVVMQWLDVAQHRFAVTVMELYDSSPRNFSLSSAIFGNRTSTQGPGGSEPEAALQLEVLSQSYFSRLPVKALGVTRTSQGLTPKQILFITQSDQVFALDKRYLDPRRPLKQKLSTQEQEERLLPYMDTLPLNPVMFASYDKQIAQLSKVVVEPSNLESTSLLFAHGVDLFYTRLSPAKAFDSLEDDFSYALLVIALAALLLGVLVVKHISSRAILKKKWE